MHERFRTRHIEGSGTFALRVWFPYGALEEDAAGLACLTGRALSEGSRRRSWLDLAVDLEDQGMSLTTFGSMELFGLSLEGLVEDWRLGLEWASEVLLEPRFADDRVDWLRRQTLAELDSLSDQPDVRTGWRFLRQLYGEHAAGRPVQGTREALSELTADDCRTFHRRALRPKPIVALAGGLEPEDALRELEDRFGGLGDEAASRHVEVETRTPSTDRVETTAADQGHLYVGHLTVPRGHEDLAALELLAVVLGAGSGLHGRIPQRIREEQGLAYTAQANTVSGASRIPGRLVVYLGTSPENLEQAESSVRRELRRLVDDGVTAEEIESARAYLLGREPFRLETSRQWGDLLAQSTYFETPWDDPAWRRRRLEAVTADDVHAAVRSHVHPDRLHVTHGVPRSAAATPHQG